MDWVTDPQRLSGLCLVVAGLAGAILAGTSARVPPAIWNGPEDVALRLIAQHATVWRLANLGFAIATVLTSVGLGILPEAVGGQGSSLARAASVAFVLGSALWLVSLAIEGSSPSSPANPQDVSLANW